ncbi:MAG: heparinase [Lentisphaerae bacterium]|nr:heparinase [Lentisphaerota bacterium]
MKHAMTGWGIGMMAAGWVGLAGVAQGAEAPDPAKLVAAAPGHPRLLWRAGGEADVAAKLAADPVLRATAEAVKLCADRMLEEPPVVYRKEGRRLLGRSREALSRTLHLSFQARMTGDRRYIERAVREMQAAAAMPDWNPSHFLDTAEMTLALAVGYDWLHPHLDPAVRATVRTAIETKGLGPYLMKGSRHGWEKGGNNWNQVCHAGMLAGALALLEDDPARAAAVVSRAVAGLPSAMGVYVPDGNYPEGPGYWGYGTTFNVIAIALLESALGADFGLSGSAGFLKTGDFMLHATGPTRLPYNFSDCGSGMGSSSALHWFAARAKRPDWLWFEMPLLDREVAQVKASGGRAPDRTLPLTLIWAAAGARPAAPSSTAWFGHGQNPLACFRTSWTNDRAAWLAAKAGTPSASHGHMDVGSFVYEADGVRWAIDLGMQGYHAMESRGLDIWNGRQGSDRWRIFRYHNRAHNTLTVDGMEQTVGGKAPMTVDGPVASVDLASLYAGQLSGARRTFELRPEGRALIADAVRGGATNRTVRWTLVTPGVLKADGASAGWLESKDRRLRIEVEGPAGIRLASEPARGPNEFDEPNPGVSLVHFDVAVPAGAEVAWRVILTPGGVQVP